jgi:hypothetical protein
MAGVRNSRKQRLECAVAGAVMDVVLRRPKGWDNVRNAQDEMSTMEERRGMNRSIASRPKAALELRLHVCYTQHNYAETMSNRRQR